jgi:hypothetical protein
LEWKITKPQNLCSGCAREIAVGESFYSWIDLTEQEPVRSDACDACFAAQKMPDRIYWRTRRQEPPVKAKKVDYERLRDVFLKMLEKIGENAGDMYRDLTYLMGLLLLRKRFYKLRAFDTQDGRDVLVLVRPKTDVTITLDAPLLSEERIALVREKLAQLLDGTIEWDGVNISSARANEVGDEPTSEL